MIPYGSVIKSLQCLYRSLRPHSQASRVADEESGYRENNNRIEFIVHKDATKPQIRDAVEQMFDVKVDKVNTRFTITGKHASVRLAEGYDAEDAALKLGAF